MLLSSPPVSSPTQTLGLSPIQLWDHQVFGLGFLDHAKVFGLGKKSAPWIIVIVVLQGPEVCNNTRERITHPWEGSRRLAGIPSARKCSDL